MHVLKNLKGDFQWENLHLGYYPIMRVIIKTLKVYVKVKGQEFTKNLISRLSA